MLNFFFSTLGKWRYEKLCGKHWDFITPFYISPFYWLDPTASYFPIFIAAFHQASPHELVQITGLSARSDRDDDYLLHLEQSLRALLLKLNVSDALLQPLPTGEVILGSFTYSSPFWCIALIHSSGIYSYCKTFFKKVVHP